jgi:hypothetical protein
MLRSTILFMLIFTAAPACWCQQDNSDLSPRTLFYREQPDTDKLPSTREGKQSPRKPDKPSAGKGAAEASTRAMPAKSGTSPSQDQASGSTRPTSANVPSVAATSAIPVVEHLGLRYNLLLVNPQNGSVEAADPDRIFKPGECIALEFEPNRSGYLYIFERASNGRWILLFPSASLAGESNAVRSRKTVRVPAKDCFEVSGVAGQEDVFAVLSRNVEDLYALNESIKASAESDPKEGTPAVLQPQTDQTILFTQLLEDEINRMKTGLQDRELRVKKVAQPEQAGERANAVYVVNASQTPSDRIFTEIHIVHR